ncbi:unnamed protein product [Arctia plantaginis]|uniref:Uncharacterized protein n=1 Tax=Arctia plantaginis TaxID=874455 RepID=A0A8S0ZZL3_ARCPL|nr:unnamed protein product [Arctia plantaginis]CAB3238301.1 unnamed protein product [Arctia plantaginis]
MSTCPYRAGSEVLTMRSLAIGFAVLITIVHIKMEDVNVLENTDVLEDILVYPIPAPVTKVKKREALNSENFNDFLVEKLTAHTQALEHLVKKVDRQEEITRQLIEHLSKSLEKPKLPTKVETIKTREHVQRRSNSFHKETENSILRLGKNIPMFGRLAKDLFMEEIKSDTDATPILQSNPDELTVEYNRRSFGGSPGIDPGQANKNELSPWCEEAMLCKKTEQSICGFDDNYGYGKFDDICHMLHVNCYYKYNFALVHTCRPTL